MTGETKQALRERVWSRLEESGEERFPGARGRIPNFNGREKAARRLARVPAYRRADRVKVNPDSPQTPIRKTALEDGKTLFMAVPKLRSKECFLELDPHRMEGSPSDWCTIKGASRHGRPVHPGSMPAIDLIVTGAVGVDREGRRLGKGGGYSDLEFGVLLEFGRIQRNCPIWTTVHPLQELENGNIPRSEHDLTLSGYARPDETVAVESVLPRPGGIDFERLSEEDREAIPILNDL